MKKSMKRLLLSLIGIAGLWFLGSAQPIRVVENSANQNQPTVCKKCGGNGSIPSSENCPKCGGSGKGEWYFKSHADIQFKDAKPICKSCRGTGKQDSRTKCPQCNGTGRENVSKTFQKKTVKAGLSWWEKMLAWFNIKPDANSKPQRRLNRYPLISKYIKTMADPAREIRILQWDFVRQEGSEWIVKTLLEFKDQDGRLNEQGMEFIVENREVKGARKVDWK